MQPSQNRLLQCVAATILLFALPSLGGMSGTDIPSSTLVAQRLLRSVFPELSDKHHIMTIEYSGPFDEEWLMVPPLSVDVGYAERGQKELMATPDGRVHVVVREPVLSALFEFDRDGSLLSGHFQSPELTSETRNAQVRKLVDSHQKWSDEQVSSALSKSGARFGPAEEQSLVRTVPVDALRPYIGAVQVDSAEFRLRHPQTPASLAELYWEVQAHSEQNGSRLDWDLDLEPFNGRLIDLRRYTRAVDQLHVGDKPSNPDR